MILKFQLLLSRNVLLVSFVLDYLENLLEIYFTTLWPLGLYDYYLAMCSPRKCPHPGRQRYYSGISEGVSGRTFAISTCILCDTPWLPPKILHNLVFHFSWVLQSFQEKQCFCKMLGGQTQCNMGGPCRKGKWIFSETKQCSQAKEMIQHFLASKLLLQHYVLEMSGDLSLEMLLKTTKSWLDLTVCCCCVQICQCFALPLQACSFCASWVKYLVNGG